MEKPTGTITHQEANAYLLGQGILSIDFVETNTSPADAVEHSNFLIRDTDESVKDFEEILLSSWYIFIARTLMCGLFSLLPPSSSLLRGSRYLQVIYLFFI